MKLTLQQKALAYGGVFKKPDNLVSYTIENGTKYTTRI